jgi:lipopolysaccharide transport system ATP-binding protein
MLSRDIAINIENMSKCYRIGLKEQIHDSLASAILSFIQNPLRNYRKYRSLYNFDDIIIDSPNKLTDGTPNIIWALQDISMDVKEGEVLGIIGKNGAGKSTLLKILSRITYPVCGRAEIRGRVSSLLEVGTGFHQELTGRENIYLNSTILGMTKKEVDRNFEEIVEFAGVEVERFIDTPIKHYSSGMEVRLAFSVAAHLEPEILLVDEVLAVGDAAFQKKCLGKMGEVARQGRTVLFVSHNMGAITELCGRALWLEHGRIKLDGNPSDVVSSYLSQGSEGKAVWRNDSVRADRKEAYIDSVRLLSNDNQPASVMAFDSSFKVEITYDVLEPIRDLSVTYQVFNSQGTMLFESMDTDLPEWKGRTREPGRYLAVCKVPEYLLKPEQYYMSVVSFVENVKIIEVHQGILTFDVSEMGYNLNPGRRGVLSPVLEWEVTQTRGSGITALEK